jgi:hypothetical protein
MASAKLPSVTASYPYSTEPDSEHPKSAFFSDHAIILTLPIKRVSRHTSVARAYPVMQHHLTFHETKAVPIASLMLPDRQPVS